MYMYDNSLSNQIKDVPKKNLSGLINRPNQLFGLCTFKISLKYLCSVEISTVIRSPSASKINQ